jgi:transposase-like protein
LSSSGRSARVAGESLYPLSKRHDISRQLVRVWVQKYEAGALDEDAQAADLLQEYEAKIAALERMVGRQALEIHPSLVKALLRKIPMRRSRNFFAGSRDFSGVQQEGVLDRKDDVAI